MIAKVFSCEHDWQCSRYELCVDEKVHLCYIRWQGPDEDRPAYYERGDGHEYRSMKPCDGSCRPKEMTLPSEVDQLIEKFLASDGKDVGEFEKFDPPKNPRPKK